NAMTRNKLATPLHVAVMQQRPEMVTHLLEADANVSAVNGSGMTALHMAAYRGDKSSTQLLLDAGAAPSLKDSGGRTPLDWALHRGNTELVDLLRERGGKAAAAPALAVPKPANTGAWLET